jgi:hypothetical protein
VSAERAEDGGAVQDDGVRPTAPDAAPAARGARSAGAGARPAATAGNDRTPEGASGAGSDTARREPAAAEDEPSDGAGAPADATADATADGDDEGELTVRDPIAVGGRFERARRGVRRFPLFTRDTAPPEGGGRAAPGDAPAPARQWPILAVLLTVGLGLLLTALDVFRVGTILIGVALLGGAALRWALPDVGMLAVRSRFTDLITYGTLGAVIVLLALMVQPSPWLVIPFLDDTLHFTIRT